MRLSYKYHTFFVTPHILRWLKQRFRYVRAAGGIVTDDNGLLLLIRRNGRWDLPKGKVEEGETLRQAALREVEEETGITCVLDSPIKNPTCLKTYHIFNLYGGWHLKQTAWFPMHTQDAHPQGVPQGEEGISEVAWCTPEEWLKRLQKSYGTLRIVSQHFIDSCSIVAL